MLSRSAILGSTALHALFLATLLLLGSVGPAGAQSFDCRTARTPHEFLICQHPALARLDQQLAILKRREIGQLSKELQEDFQANEVHFMNALRRCGDSYRCIEQSYLNRTRELEGLLAQSTRDGTGGATASTGKADEPRAGRQSKRTTSTARKPQSAGAKTEEARETEPQAPAEPSAGASAKQEKKREAATASAATATPQPKPKPAEMERPATAAGSTAPPQWINPAPAR